MKRSNRTTRTASDPVTDYAERVLRGDIIAGPHVRASCERHIRDIHNAHTRGYVFDVARALHACGFFPSVLRLNGGEFEGAPFVLQPWQTFVVGSLFGWINAETDRRRFQSAYVETGKGSGKSPLAAGIGLYMLLADNEPRAEVYAAATKKDQAMILFRDAVAMVQQSPRLREAVQASGKNPVWNLAHLKSASFFRAMSADKAQSGPRPHCGLIDELHEHPDATVLELLRAGTKGRRQPLMFMITNAGSSRSSVCFDYHDYAAKVAHDMIDDDEFFSYVCALDDGDKPFSDESCWIKTNPTLGVTIQHDYIRKQVREAQKIPSKEAIVKRLHFCQWTEAVSPWLSYEAWIGAAEAELDHELLLNRPAWGGLDLSATTDITAFVLAFEPTKADPHWRLVSHFWLPDRGLADKSDRDKVPYTVWRDHGYLRTTDSVAVDKRTVVRDVAQIIAQYDVREIAYDRWGIATLQAALEHEGIELPLAPFGQGFVSMGPAISEFETLLLNGELRHTANPVLTWNAANAVTTADPAGNRKLDKNKARGRIDGIVAAVMAIGRAKQVGLEDDISGFISAPVRVGR